MEGKSQGLKWSAAHIIPRHPKCGRMHGHDYTLDVKIVIPESNDVMLKLQELGYVIDYGDVKSVAKRLIEPLDHHFLVPRTKLIEMGENTNVQSTEYGITLPSVDFCALDIPLISSENLSLYFKNKFMGIFEPFVVYCKVNEGDGQGVWL